MFWTSLIPTVATLMAATPSLASNLVWYTEPGSNSPAFSTGEKVRGVNLGNWFILVSEQRLRRSYRLIPLSGPTGKLDGTVAIWYLRIAGSR